MKLGIELQKLVRKQHYLYYRKKLYDDFILSAGHPVFLKDLAKIIIEETKSKGFYVDDNRRSHLFDFGRTTAKYFQKVLPAKMGNVIFLGMKSFYRKRLKDKVKFVSLQTSGDVHEGVFQI